MPKSRKGPSRIELAMEKFTKQGPYTLNATLRVAKMCARSKDRQIGDSLDEIIHKFSPEELDKLIHWKRHVPLEDHAAWCLGTGGSYDKLGNGRVAAKAWRLKNLDEGLTDRHLDVIVNVSNSTFHGLLTNIEAKYLSVATRRRMLNDMRTAAGEQSRGWQAEYDELCGRDRDSSPE